MSTIIAVELFTS